MNKLVLVPYDKYQRLIQRDSHTGGSLVLGKTDPTVQPDTSSESIVPDRKHTRVHSDTRFESEASKIPPPPGIPSRTIRWLKY